MDFGYSKEEEQFRQKLGEFLDKNLTEEIARQNWEDKGVMEAGREFSKKLADNGFLGMSWPVEYGGRGLGPNYEFILLDELGKRWGAHVPLDIGYTMVGHTILRRGSEELKKEFLPKIIKGEIEFSLGYSEPNSGSDLASITMKAEDKGDFFLVNGQKTFNTESHYSEYHWLAVRTDNSPGSPPYKGISLFIVDHKSPGIEVAPMETMSGEWTNEVFYDDVKVPKNRLVGELNKGFYYVMEALASERNTVFIASRLRPILDMTVEYVKNTEFNGTPLSEDPVIKNKLGQIAIDIEVAEVLGEHARWLEMTEQPMTHQPEMAKVMISELKQKMVNDCMEIMGNFGHLREGSKYALNNGRMEWLFLHQFMTTLGGGTSEVGRNVIAQRGLDMPR